MKRLFTFRLFFKSLFFVVLLGFYGAGMVHYCYQIINADLDSMELCDTAKGDSGEKEKKGEEEMDCKIYLDFYFLKLISAQPEMKVWLNASIYSTHHPEIPTQPPRFAIFFS